MQAPVQILPDLLIREVVDAAPPLDGSAAAVVDVTTVLTGTERSFVAFLGECSSNSYW
jgi:hypothetical protein